MVSYREPGQFLFPYDTLSIRFLGFAHMLDLVTSGYHFHINARTVTFVLSGGRIPLRN